MVHIRDCSGFMGEGSLTATPPVKMEKLSGITDSKMKLDLDSGRRTSPAESTVFCILGNVQYTKGSEKTC